jgi:two-component system, cell cycle response regulator
MSRVAFVDAECQVSPYITAIRVSLTSIKAVVQLSQTTRIDQRDSPPLRHSKETHMIIEQSAALSTRSRAGFFNFDLPQRMEARPPCRILVVDDDILVRAQLSTLLTATQYQVETAATGIEALRVIEATPCDIVLTDWLMPDMDGPELCRQLRLQTHNPDVYVLMLTVRNTELDMTAGLAAGADDYVVKGAPFHELLARLGIGRRITNQEHLRKAREQKSGGLPQTDPVTGAYTLRYLEQHLMNEWERAQQRGHPLAVLDCELEGLEQIKAGFGLDASDELLCAFVARAENCIRKSDWLARTGEKEFLIVLPETSTQGAHGTAGKLREHFALHPLASPEETLGFTLKIRVDAMATQKDVRGAVRINARSRALERGTHGSDSPGREVAEASPSGPKRAAKARTAGRNGLI